MQASQAFDEFEAALKAKKAAEIAHVGAENVAGASDDLRKAQENAEAAALRLMTIPATGSSALVLKARAIRWRFPNGVPIHEPTTLGGVAPLSANTPLAVAMAHYLVRDMLALAG